MDRQRIHRCGVSIGLTPLRLSSLNLQSRCSRSKLELGASSPASTSPTRSFLWWVTYAAASKNAAGVGLPSCRTVSPSTEGSSLHLTALGRSRIYRWWSRTTASLESFTKIIFSLVSALPSITATNSWSRIKMWQNRPRKHRNKKLLKVLRCDRPKL